MPAQLRELESLFLALGDKTRLRLLSLMVGGPVAVGLLAEKLGESQPKVSRHLAYLRNCGVVSTERDGKHIYYRIESPADESVNDVLTAVIDSLADTPHRSKRRPGRRNESAPKTIYPPSESHIEEEPVEEMEPVDVYENVDESELDDREELDIFLL